MNGPNLIPPLPQTIDPLAPGQHGRYDDHLVSVLHAEPACDRAADPVAPWPLWAPWVPWVPWFAPTTSA